MTQQEQYERFRALHMRAGAFIMPNAWDAMSAALLAREGFEAIGSTSIAIAFALGRRDGHHEVSRVDAIANAALLARASKLPINGDLEDGFGPAPEDCVATVEAAIAAGLAGLGIEDTTADPARPIHDFDHAVARVAAAAKAAKGRILLTARADNFIKGRPDLDDTVRRLVAFAQAGADVLYAPFLPTMDAIETVVKAVAPLPVNVMMGPFTGLVPLAQLSAAGVKRVSLGGALYVRALDGLLDAARALKQGDIPSAAPTLHVPDLIPLLPD
ncbi:MAG TPA: isocitrate lyase/phosphoenolpyruvate mutase family protein [Sphingobium sp.]|nr:isocitrate lyase/phosphoenolpyruvate mutase family protein [Sphingobium sp.]